MNILEKALQETIKKVEGDKPKSKKYKIVKCSRCGHWYNSKGESGINHKRFCSGK